MSRLALPWDFAGKVKEFLKPHTRLLFLGEGEALLPFRHPPERTAFAGREPFCPYLAPLGIRTEPCGPGTGPLPFGDGEFDLAVAWYAPYDLAQIHRVLKAGGFFLTQQVGGAESRGAPPDYNLENQLPRFRRAGFRVMYANQAYPAERAGDREVRRHRFAVIGKKT
ncbi:MAG: class I SAM-dependent methyltransferase [Acutalibacter sp.]|jgi:hypothetical protein|nr:class I SAM-dependent methyltransferase [Acutalibacter sp.]